MDKKIVPDFPNYMVSADGSVYNINGNRIAEQLTNSGYSIVHLHRKGTRKAHTIHRLVAKLYIPNPENKDEVNHIDGNKQNNSSSNLEWVTKSENAAHALASGLTVKTREKAKERMKIIGKEHANENVKHLLESNKKLRKPVIQCNLDGVEIKEYASVKEARRLSKCHNINHVLSGRASQSGGFKWKYKIQTELHF